MSGAVIKIEGLDALKKKFKQLPQVVTDTLDAEMFAISEEYVNRAIGMVPIDEGTLKVGITASHAELHHEIVSKESYSPYVEFGTRTRVSVPADLTSYANQFRRKGGGDAKKAIYDWCKRKGIPEEAWWPIFIKVMTVGISPHPFFFPHLPWAKSELKKRSKQVIQKALK